jgi:glucose-1-phosphate cytidylyltransferase
MKTIILCGGRGMRLNEETEYRPKPLVPVGQRPMLWHIMQIYAQSGLREFILCLGYRGDMIKDYYLNYDSMSNDCTVHMGQNHKVTFENSHNEQDYLVTLADTGLESMTGCRVKKIEKYINEETFMLTYGDGVCDVDINALLKFHYDHGRCATVTSVHPTSRYGVLNVDKSGTVTNFAENPVMNDWMSAGFFVFNRKIFDYLTTDESCILEQGPLQRLAQEGELMAFKHEGFFFSMDTYRDYRYLNDMWDKGQTPWLKK